MLGTLAAAALGGSFARAQAAVPRATPFTVRVPAVTVNRILRRVRDTRFPDKLESNDWRYGANWDYLRELTTYWATKYDWRKAEARLNRYPQFKASIDGYEIHFYHVKGKGPNAVPLVLTHGWPGSVFEFQEAIAPLTESGDISFDVIVPSLPGFGFSSKPQGKPVGPRTTAVLWHKLMTEVLGYSRYGAQGGDWGNAVTLDLAALYPEALIGIHLNGTGTIAQVPESEQTAEERAWIKAAAAFRSQEVDYFNIQMHKPQTVAFALADNPVGWLAWMTEKLKAWSDSGDNIEKAFTKDQILTNAMIYLVNGAEATGVWFYRGQADDGPNPIRGKINVPTGFASFPAEMTVLNPPRHFLERALNLVHYSKMPRGGHFAAMEQPDLLAADVRTFFSKIK